MKYKNIVEGVFVSRPNRFIANVVIDGVEQIVHVKNTGRCRELLVEGAKVYLSVSDNLARKTKYDLVAVEKVTSRGVLLINMDSQIPNDVVSECFLITLFIVVSILMVNRALIYMLKMVAGRYLLRLKV